jgi:hypothetical protein
MSKERELLERARNMIDYRYATSEAIVLTKEIQELLTQPEPKPVAWMWEQQNPHSGEWDSEFAEGKPQNFRVVRNIRPLYTLPPKQEPVTNEPTTTTSAAVMPNGVCVSNVYDAYEEGRKSVMTKQEQLVECIKIIDSIKEIAIENEWHVDKAMSSAVLGIVEYFNIDINSTS